MSTYCPRFERARILTARQVHEKNFAKLISCVFQNALKFTENGKVDISTTLDRATHAIVTTIMDNGSGIQPSFQDQMFKPFTKEDNSISRVTEGLGLGLLVAKGLSRKLGGDLVLVRSETEGPTHGSVRRQLRNSSYFS